MPEIDDFERKVLRCSRHDSPELIRNSTINHAAVLIRTLIQSAYKRTVLQSRRKEPIRLLVGCLRKDFYSSDLCLHKDIKEAMDVGCKVSLIILNATQEQLEDNRFYQAVEDHANGSVLLLANDPTIEDHAVVIGERAYRLETSHDHHTAQASFNSPGMAQLLSEKHDEILRLFDVEPPSSLRTQSASAEEPHVEAEPVCV